MEVVTAAEYESCPSEVLTLAYGHKLCACATTR
jgi:hypothetical protein